MTIPYAMLGNFFALRSFDPWEGEALFKMTGDPDVMHYMGFELHKTVAEAEALIVAYKTNPKGRYLAVIDPSAPYDVLGVLGIEINGHQATSMVMFRRCRAARVATRETAIQITKYFFAQPQIWRVWSFCHVDNVRAQRLTEKIGGTREGLLRRFALYPNISTEPQDAYMYSIVR